LVAAKPVVEPKAASSASRSVTLLSRWFGDGPCLVGTGSTVALSKDEVSKIS
jgi:hypothetical protein